MTASPSAQTWRHKWAGLVFLWWALLGPSLVLLVEVESAFVLIDGLRPSALPEDLHGGRALVAGTVLLVVVGAQIALALLHGVQAAHQELTEQRAVLEEKVLIKLTHPLAYGPWETMPDAPTPLSDLLIKLTHPPAYGPWETMPAPQSDAPTPLSGLLVVPSLRALRSHLKKLTSESPNKSDDPTGRRTLRWHLRKLASDSSARRKNESGDATGRYQVALLRRIVHRFGLEPSWAVRTLDSLGVPAARAIARDTKALDARWAGRITAFLFAALAFGLAFVIDETIPQLVFAAGLVVVLFFQFHAARAAGRALLRHEFRYYLHIEPVLELHRFDLYRALAVRSPRYSHEEQMGPLAAWRLGSDDISFDTAAAPDVSGMQDQVAGVAQQLQGDVSGVRDQVASLAQLLRGPELVPYDGFVSWHTRSDGVDLAFARTPILSDGYARIQVTGSGEGPLAPFDITADSSDVALVQVRATVAAPIDGATARTTFDFRSAENAISVPELWFEISQHGRFLQLLRIRITASPQPPAID
jgi:hypothetical protein